MHFESSWCYFTAVPLEIVVKAFDAIVPLDSSASVDLLSEDVRVRGQDVVEYAARVLRNEGNELFKSGSSLTGEARAEAFKTARKKYELAYCLTEEDAITNANLAALCLADKE